MVGWVVFPVSVFFGVIAMFLGTGFAPMFLLFFLLVLKMPFHAAVGATLVVEIFGFMIGLEGYVRKRSVAYLLSYQMLCLAIPAAVVGVIASTYLPLGWSLALLGALLFVVAGLIIHPEHELLSRRDQPEVGYVISEYGLARSIEIVSSTLSGMFAGMVGTGVGEINNYVFLKKYRMPGNLAAGTTVFVIAVTAVFAAAAHGVVLFLDTPNELWYALEICFYAVPGVVLGALIGSQIPNQMSDALRERAVASLFIAQAVLAFVTLINI